MPNVPVPSERSLTPVLPDFMDASMCYLPSGYPYYYGGNRLVAKPPSFMGFSLVIKCHCLLCGLLWLSLKFL